MTAQTQHIVKIIDQENPNQLNWDNILTKILKSFDCTTGSIHVLNQETNVLHIKAHKGIPEFLLPKMTIVPVGKGMAGVAAERMEPVQICNLQTDDSGIARPSAKDTKVEGAITAPLIFNGKLYGTLGIAKSVPYDFTEEETESLMKIGEVLAQKINPFL